MASGYSEFSRNLGKSFCTEVVKRLLALSGFSQPSYKLARVLAPALVHFCDSSVCQIMNQRLNLLSRLTIFCFSFEVIFQKKNEKRAPFCKIALL